MDLPGECYKRIHLGHPGSWVRIWPGPVFFSQTGNILFQIKVSANYLSAYLLLAQLSHLGMIFFAARILNVLLFDLLLQ